MSQPAVVVRFETHDELVLAYSSRLSTGKIRIKSARALTPGTRVLVKLEVSEQDAGIAVPAQVLETKSLSTGGHATLVEFESQQARQELEAFIVGADPSQSGSEPEPEHRPITVAVIDDNETQRQFAAAPFRARGDTVHTAEDGLAGLALCLQCEPDVILSDVQMPKADGWQLLRMLRARKALQDVPIIFLTTLSSESSRLRGYRLGVDDYLAKPYSQDALVARVDRVVQRRKVEVHTLAPGANNSLRGDLQHVSLPALLSFLELEQKSGILHLEPQGSVIQVRNGQPIRARSPQIDSMNHGEQALFDLLDHGQGRFEFVPTEVEETDTIQMPLGQVLMEHARLSDERAERISRSNGPNGVA